MPQTLLAHFIDHVRHGGVGAYAGKLIARVHNALDAAQLNSEVTARVECGVVGFIETPFLEQRHGQRITHSQHGGGRGGGRQSQRARFLPNSHVDHRLACLRQCRSQIARQ